MTTVSSGCAHATTRVKHDEGLEWVYCPDCEAILSARFPRVDTRHAERVAAYKTLRAAWHARTWR